MFGNTHIKAKWCFKRSFNCLKDWQEVGFHLSWISGMEADWWLLWARWWICYMFTSQWCLTWKELSGVLQLKVRNNNSNPGLQAARSNLSLRSGSFWCQFLGVFNWWGWLAVPAIPTNDYNIPYEKSMVLGMLDLPLPDFLFLFI